MQDQINFSPKKGMRATIRSLVAGMKYGLGNAGALGRIYRESRDGFIPFEFQSIALGVDYALFTGRLHAKADIAVRALRPQEVGKLVCDLYYNGIIVQADVPAAINKRYQ